MGFLNFFELCFFFSGEESGNDRPENRVGRVDVRFDGSVPFVV